jgi:hypothetical protein
MVTAPLEASTAPGPVVERMRAADPAARYRRVPDYARLAVHADATGYVQNQVRARVTGALHALVGEARQVHIHGPPIAQAEGALLTEALEGPHPLAGGALLGTPVLHRGRPPAPGVVGGGRDERTPARPGGPSPRCEPPSSRTGTPCPAPGV